MLIDKLHRHWLAADYGGSAVGYTWGYFCTLIAVLSAVSILNPSLTLGVVRRLRSGPMIRPINCPGVLSVGAMAGNFAAWDLRDRPVSPDQLSGHTLVGFLSPECPSCLERRPDVVAVSAAFGPERSWAVAGGLTTDDRSVPTAA
jgi:hypothetical protein